MSILGHKAPKDSVLSQDRCETVLSAGASRCLMESDTEAAQLLRADHLTTAERDYAHTGVYLRGGRGDASAETWDVNLCSDQSDNKCSLRV